MAKTFSDYLTALGDYVLEQGGDTKTAIAGAAGDSRECKSGFVFCALQGERVDGAQFVPMALANGAVAVLADRRLDLPPGIPWAVVREPYHAFARVAEFSRDFPARALQMLGITGTNGKTTTAYLLRDILAQAGKHCGMLGTVEYDLGQGCILPADRTTPTPFQVQEMLAAMRDKQVEYAVLEVSSHALAQQRLGSAVFAGAIFTNLTRDHLDFHHTFENYYQSKKLLFEQCLDRSAPMVVNIDDPWGQRLADELHSENVYTFSLKGNKARVRAEGIRLAEDCSEFILQLPGERWQLHTPLLGHYNVSNVTAAVTLAYALQLPGDAIRTAVSRCQGAPGRLQRLALPNGAAAFVDYAHTDDALSNALAALRPVCRGQLLVLFGCGGNRDRSKRPLMAAAACSGADWVLISSDNPRNEAPEEIIKDILTGVPPGQEVTVEPDRAAAIHLALAQTRPGDMLLIAGKGHENYQECQGRKTHFSDVECVQDYIRKQL
jgi:UDP-N-acetylmuramoyl-L-alanyl-D-glutamate--2,6-diaminopimelate ligase